MISRSRLTVICLLLWFGASAAARVVGIWPALGATTILLTGVAALAGFNRTLPPSNPSGRSMLWGAAVGSVMVAATHLIYPAAVSYLPSLTSETQRLHGYFLTPPASVEWLLLAPVIVAEELLWRGLLLGVLFERCTRIASVAAGAGLYAAANLALGSPVLALVALAGGLIWGGLRATHGSWAAVVAHLTWSYLVLWTVPYL